MKTLALLAVILALNFSCLAEEPTWQELSARAFTNASIVWQANTDGLPKSFWTYKIIRPHVFSRGTISNAIVLGHLQARGFPEPSTNGTCISDDCHCSCVVHCFFSTYPDGASLNFSSPLQTNSTQHIPSDSQITKWAWSCAFRLGVDPTQVVQKDFTTHFNSDTNGNSLMNEISGRGVYLSRILDGIAFNGDGTDTCGDGFWIEFGSYDLIRNFSLIWHDLKKDQQIPTASTAQIIQCIRAHKTIVFPEPHHEEDYFPTLKMLARTKRLTITQLTPYYGEGVFGVTPTNGAPEAFMTPYAELQAVADFGTSNLTIRIASPIISTDVERLLRK
jgi:hypothetical protein